MVIRFCKDTVWFHEWPFSRPKGRGKWAERSESRLQDQFPFRKIPIQCFSGRPSVAIHCEGHRTVLASLQRSGSVLPGLLEMESRQDFNRKLALFFSEERCGKGGDGDRETAEVEQTAVSSVCEPPGSFRLVESCSIAFCALSCLSQSFLGRFLICKPCKHPPGGT